MLWATPRERDHRDHAITGNQGSFKTSCFARSGFNSRALDVGAVGAVGGSPARGDAAMNEGNKGNNEVDGDAPRVENMHLAAHFARPAAPLFTFGPTNLSSPQKKLIIGAQKNANGDLARDNWSADRASRWSSPGISHPRPDPSRAQHHERVSGQQQQQQQQQQQKQQQQQPANGHNFVQGGSQPSLRSECSMSPCAQWAVSPPGGESSRGGSAPTTDRGILSSRSRARWNPFVGSSCVGLPPQWFQVGTPILGAKPWPPLAPEEGGTASVAPPNPEAGVIEGSPSAATTAAQPTQPDRCDATATMCNNKNTSSNDIMKASHDDDAGGHDFLVSAEPVRRETRKLQLLTSSCVGHPIKERREGAKSPKTVSELEPVGEGLDEIPSVAHPIDGDIKFIPENEQPSVTNWDIPNEKSAQAVKTSSPPRRVFLPRKKKQRMSNNSKLDRVSNTPFSPTSRMECDNSSTTEPVPPAAVRHLVLGEPLYDLFSPHSTGSRSPIVIRRTLNVDPQLFEDEKSHEPSPKKHTPYAAFIVYQPELDNNKMDPKKDEHHGSPSITSPAASKKDEKMSTCKEDEKILSTSSISVDRPKMKTNDDDDEEEGSHQLALNQLCEGNEDSTASCPPGEIASNGGSASVVQPPTTHKRGDAHDARSSISSSWRTLSPSLEPRKPVGDSHALTPIIYTPQVSARNAKEADIATEEQVRKQGTEERNEKVASILKGMKTKTAAASSNSSFQRRPLISCTTCTSFVAKRPLNRRSSMPCRTEVLMNDNDVNVAIGGGPWKCSDNGLQTRKKEERRARTQELDDEKEEDLDWDEIFRKRPKKIVYYKALSPSLMKKQDDEHPRKARIGTEYGVNHGIRNREKPSPPRSHISELDSLRDDEHDVSYLSEFCNNPHTHSSSSQRGSGDNQVNKGKKIAVLENGREKKRRDINANDDSDSNIIISTSSATRSKHIPQQGKSSSGRIGGKNSRGDVEESGGSTPDSREFMGSPTNIMGTNRSGRIRRQSNRSLNKQVCPPNRNEDEDSNSNTNTPRQRKRGGYYMRKYGNPLPKDNEDEACSDNEKDLDYDSLNDIILKRGSKGETKKKHTHCEKASPKKVRSIVNLECESSGSRSGSVSAASSSSTPAEESGSEVYMMTIKKKSIMSSQNYNASNKRNSLFSNSSHGHQMNEEDDNNEYKRQYVRHSSSSFSTHGPGKHLNINSSRRSSARKDYGGSVLSIDEGNEVVDNETPSSSSSVGERENTKGGKKKHGEQHLHSAKNTRQQQRQRQRSQEGEKRRSHDYHVSARKLVGHSSEGSESEKQNGQSASPINSLDRRRRSSEYKENKEPSSVRKRENETMHRDDDDDYDVGLFKSPSPLKAQAVPEPLQCTPKESPYAASVPTTPGYADHFSYSQQANVMNRQGMLSAGSPDGLSRGAITNNQQQLSLMAPGVESQQGLSLSHAADVFSSPELRVQAERMEKRREILLNNLKRMEEIRRRNLIRGGEGEEYTEDETSGGGTQPGSPCENKVAPRSQPALVPSTPREMLKASSGGMDLMLKASEQHDVYKDHDDGAQSMVEITMTTSQHQQQEHSKRAEVDQKQAFEKFTPELLPLTTASHTPSDTPSGRRRGTSSLASSAGANSFKIRQKQNILLTAGSVRSDSDENIPHTSIAKIDKDNRVGDEKGVYSSSVMGVYPTPRSGSGTTTPVHGSSSFFRFPEKPVSYPSSTPNRSVANSDIGEPRSDCSVNQDSEMHQCALKDAEEQDEEDDVDDRIVL